jgi:hypothetical protein
MEEVTVGFLMQIDKLVLLLESPIFVHLRLQLLDVESRYHAPLLKSIYGLLMCLPQGDAFRLLNDRLTTVCNLRENLGISPLPDSSKDMSSTNMKSMQLEKLLKRFDEVVVFHRKAKERSHKLAVQAEQSKHQSASQQYESTGVLSMDVSQTPGTSKLSSSSTNNSVPSAVQGSGSSRRVESIPTTKPGSPFEKRNYGDAKYVQ